MKRCNNWVVFYSRTGYGIIQLIRETQLLPRAIVTTKRSEDITDEMYALVKEHQIPIVFMPQKPASANYTNILKKTDFITLHGWMRIIPEDVCVQYAGRIYNLHPGLVTKYPELKGKDPQDRTVSGKYNTCGCVIHEVIAGVDEGEVIDSCEIQCVPESIFSDLSDVALQMWIKFLLSRKHEL